MRKKVLSIMAAAAATVGLVLVASTPASASSFQGRQSCAGGTTHYAGVRGTMGQFQLDFTDTVSGKHIRVINTDGRDDYKVYSPYHSVIWQLDAIEVTGTPHGICS